MVHVQNESQDGYDTVEWAATLPSSNASSEVLAGRRGGDAIPGGAGEAAHLAGICPTGRRPIITMAGTIRAERSKRGHESGRVDSREHHAARAEQDTMRSATKVLPLISYPVLDHLRGWNRAVFQGLAGASNFDDI